MHMDTIPYEKLFQAFFEHAPSCMAIADGEGRFLEANPAFLESLGYTREELGRLTLVEVTHLDDRPETLRLIQKVRRGDSDSYRQEKRCITRTGGCMWVAATTTVLRQPGGAIRYWLEIMSDAAERTAAEKERRRLAARMQQAQRMEAVGTLARGMAHEFNNLLMGILGNISLLLLNKDQDHKDVAYLKNVENSVLSAAELTRGILDFARGKQEEKAIDLNLLLETTSDLFGRSKKELTVRRNLQPGLSTIEGDQEEIRLVLLNLLVNAWQAMPQGGDLLLETENLTISRDDPIKPPDAVSGPYVRVSISDTGVGMSPAVQARIFEPFFTTREAGEATGLGLSSALAIIKDHRGFITVRSEEGKGSTFSILMPASKAFPPHKSETPKTSRPAAKTILLVEDEDLVADIGRQMLERLGHNVLLAATGHEALSLYEKHRHEIDLVILDMIMPAMGGGEVFDCLKAINPDVAVLLSSGYSLNGQAQEIMDRGCKGFLQKPFSVEKLSRKIRDILSIP